MKHIRDIRTQVFEEDDGSIYYSVIQQRDDEKDEVLAYGEAVDEADANSSCLETLREVLS